jgi:GTPase SAR1 family protein
MNDNIIVYFLGQPCSGKTTLANYFYDNFYKSEDKKPFKIDGDKMRSLFKNFDYSKEGRIANLNKSADLATYLHSEGYDVLMSLVCPYVEAREYLENKNIPVLWVFLDYEKVWDVRGRENFHAEDFDKIGACPLNYVIVINTTQTDVKDCYEEIKNYYLKIKSHLKNNN